MGPPSGRDEGWFTKVYDDHYQQILQYGRRRLADLDAPAELAQEVFAVAWRRRDEVPERCLPWLYGVSRRLLANHWRAGRAAGRQVPITDADVLRQPGATGADATVGVADVRAALRSLSDLDQEILRLIGWEELTVAEAAQVLGCSRTTAAVRLHRARTRLTAAMAAAPTPPVQHRRLARS
ncbi:RNA polymerase sigma factor [Catellatospora citrea]|uniref:DNA-directed RNA polymerase sigma-70 factor n=1 Tax=Catellatospora citrea TaxID=53366 RepID=A0A8J3K7W5_9ACTN|nr:sigma-70 family RNA polymerase sigma factor [Catellatospora citrea]RKE07602.1 RNA polymerase sigma-70 factor (ECF subfamily) [Catellatospora citrea]GIF95759.1 DNA-directed RNA polymerase sigma-70 factor [Catellatospora citrea]